MASKAWTDLVRGSIERQVGHVTDAKRIAKNIFRLPENFAKLQIGRAKEKTKRFGVLLEEMYKPEKDPEKMTELALNVILGGAVAARPGASEATLGMVKAARPARKAIREIMIGEMKVRGRPINPFAGKVGGIDTAVAKGWLEETPYIGNLKIKELVDYVVRGPWFHGRKTYPKPGETFAGSRFRTGNLGEPSGMSLTASKELLRSGFAKTPSRKIDEVLSQVSRNMIATRMQLEKLSSKSRPFEGLQTEYKRLQSLRDKLEFARSKILDKGTPFARVTPLLGGPPSEKILPAWKGPGTEFSERILMDAYGEALKKQPNIFTDIAAYKSGGKWTEVDPQLLSWIDFYRKNKGIAPQPSTGDPNRLYVSARRAYTIVQQGIEGVKRGGEKLRFDWKDLLDQPEFNKEIGSILSREGYKGLLYSPERGGYKEYELRMLDPADVLMMDMRKQADKGLEKLFGKIGLEGLETFPPGFADQYKHLHTSKQGKRMLRWTNELRELPSSLRDIYKDIDLESLFRGK